MAEKHFENKDANTYFFTILGQKFRTFLGHQETPVQHLRTVNDRDAILRYRQTGSCRRGRGHFRRSARH